jgi:HlyD family secretion protein
MKRVRQIVITLLVIGILGLAGWGGSIVLKKASAASLPRSIPVTAVKRGDITISVNARGELQGGNSQVLAAPMTGSRDMAITFLRKPGEVIKDGDVVAKLDTTEEEFKLREAEADLAEAEQHVVQATAESKAREEEDNYALIKARAELDLAKLEARRNPLVASIIARQNDLAVAAADDQLRQLTQDLSARRATADASIAIQEAARKKAQAQMEMAHKNIDSMTLTAKRSGYVAVEKNENNNFWYPGLVLPMLQLGDTVNPGKSIAQIPDLRSWEATARISELDRGHLAVGQAAAVEVVALPGKILKGRVNNLGGTAGPPWNRRFECKIALDEISPLLRPGMSTQITITTSQEKGVLWVPSQALFESDGRTFVYAQTADGFRPLDVKLVSRSESQVVLSGVKEGQLVAMASPDQVKDTKKAGGAGAATKALTK